MKIKEEMIIHCNTKEKLEMLVEELIKMHGNQESQALEYWDTYRENTCINIYQKISYYESKTYYESCGYKVIEFEDILEPKDFLKIGKVAKVEMVTTNNVTYNKIESIESKEDLILLNDDYIEFKQFDDNFETMTFIFNDNSPIYTKHTKILKIYDNDLNCIWDREKDLKPEVDWSKIPIDTKILVKDKDSDEWIKRHFAGVTKHNRISTFLYGGTSWSKNEDEINTWKYAKLYNESEDK